MSINLKYKKGEHVKKYSEMSKEELLSEKEILVKEYDEYKKLNLELNMARGKPSLEQLDFSKELLNSIDTNIDDYYIDKDSGIDVRNYGCLTGLSGAKKILADMVGDKEEHVIVLGNSSLNVMYDQIARAMTKGIMGSKPWGKYEKIKWICPVPGYDRHFKITEHFGFEMINVDINEDGPDMDKIEELIKDENVKGIWCVPKYENPLGTSYSPSVVKRFAALKPKAKDFRIFWDNAYCVHHLYEDESKQDKIPNILEEAKKCKNPDMVFEFVSTSKITFPGAGISAIITSDDNIKDILESMSVQTIGHDKINQLRHIKFLKDFNGLKEQMKKHARVLRPKFEIVLEGFKRELGKRDCGTWTKPRGGYFITFKSKKGLAKKIVETAKNAGLILTDAGAPFPYKKDPNDSAIRIAPSFPSEEDLKVAIKLFTVCVRLETVDKLLNAHKGYENDL